GVMITFRQVRSCLLPRSVVCCCYQPRSSLRAVGFCRSVPADAPVRPARVDTLPQVMIRFEKVTKSYRGGVTAVKELSLEIGKGEFVFIVVPSGSGKSTCLRL